MNKTKIINLCIIIAPPVQNNFGLQSCFVLKSICMQQDIEPLKYNRHNEKDKIHPFTLSFILLIHTRTGFGCNRGESGSFRPLSRSPLSRFAHFPFRPESFRPRVVSPTFPFAPESFRPLSRSPPRRLAPL